MKTDALNTLDAKLQVIRMLIEEMEHNTPEHDEEDDALCSIMHTYEQLLIRSSERRPTTVREILGMKRAVRLGNVLLNLIHEDNAEEMTGWYQGVHSQNKTMTLANLVGRIVLELNKVLRAFQRKYPKELNHHLNHELAQYASIVN